MNLVLVEPGEVSDDIVILADRRAEHLRTVLGATVGSRLRAGVLGGSTGTAEVLAIDGDRFTLRLALDAAPLPPMPVELVLAVPRPKALTRVVEAAASFAVARIALTNAWRVDKSYLRSPRLEDAALAHAARLGAEQGATTHVPAITIHQRLMQLFERGWTDATTRLVAHPGGIPIERADVTGTIVLAIGPEGGWIQREVDTFVERGFTQVSLAPTILRVETAVAAALGQLGLLLRR